MYPIPLPGNMWGVWDFLRETPWAESIPIVSKSGLDHALHGYATQKFVTEMGTATHLQGRKIPPEVGYCREFQNRMCAMRTVDCRPGDATPECYRSVGEDPMSLVTTMIVRAWAEGRHVFVVDEEK